MHIISLFTQFDLHLNSVQYSNKIPCACHENCSLGHESVLTFRIVNNYGKCQIADSHSVDSKQIYDWAIWHWSHTKHFHLCAPLWCILNWNDCIVPEKVFYFYLNLYINVSYSLKWFQWQIEKKIRNKNRSSTPFYPFCCAVYRYHYH